jgi:eukaryotic-like serine/threonine-protein kinase
MSEVNHHLAPDATTPRVASDATDPEGDDLEVLAGTPYRVLGKIGAGGMGTILEAEHRELGKRVVVKLLQPKYASEPRLVERLKREARILARIASPHIVTVSDLGQTAGGLTFIAMERLYGHTLGRELRARRTLPVVEAIHWTRDILAGLAAAHRAGVVHRDVKLDNIFLCDATDQEPRRIKLLDFGIAKVLKDATAGMDPSRNHLTAEGQRLGSPRWLAPEQARGKAVDARADIYAMGLLLYTLVAGRGPFSHIRDPFDAIEASLTSEPAPPSKYAQQDIPIALDDAILMAIEKDPDHRFQSAEAFSTALASIASGLEDVTQPIPANFVWRRVGAVSSTSSPGAPEPGLSLDPTRVERAERVHVEYPPARDVRAGDGRNVSIGAFVGLAAASMLFFFGLLALVVHFTGVR